MIHSQMERGWHNSASLTVAVNEAHSSSLCLKLAAVSVSFPRFKWGNALPWLDVVWMKDEVYCCLGAFHKRQRRTDFLRPFGPTPFHRPWYAYVPQCLLYLYSFTQMSSFGIKGTVFKTFSIDPLEVETQGYCSCLFDRTLFMSLLSRLRSLPWNFWA